MLQRDSTKTLARAIIHLTALLPSKTASLFFGFQEIKHKVRAYVDFITWCETHPGRTYGL